VLYVDFFSSFEQQFGHALFIVRHLRAAMAVVLLGNLIVDRCFDLVGGEVAVLCSFII
jgi:hypothetical protein